MPTSYVLIDFESVQPQSLSRIAKDPYRVLVFVGPNQTKLPFDIIDSVQRMGDRAQYVRIAGAGHNALDFHIAFYIGELAANDSTAFFHIISKDTGFDPLIRHLKERHIFAARSASIEEMPEVRSNPKRAAQERARLLVESLRQPKASRPRTDKSLRRHIATHFMKQQLDEAQIAAVVKALHSAGHISIDGEKVAYSLGSA